LQENYLSNKPVPENSMKKILSSPFFDRSKKIFFTFITEVKKKEPYSDVLSDLNVIKKSKNIKDEELQNLHFYNELKDIPSNEERILHLFNKIKFMVEKILNKSNKIIGLIINNKKSHTKRI
jgi:hypothetical protein